MFFILLLLLIPPSFFVSGSHTIAIKAQKRICYGAIGMKETRYIVEETFKSGDVKERSQQLNALLEKYLQALQSRMMLPDGGEGRKAG